MKTNNLLKLRFRFILGCNNTNNQQLQSSQCVDWLFFELKKGISLPVLSLYFIEMFQFKSTVFNLSLPGADITDLFSTVHTQSHIK